MELSLGGVISGVLEIKADTNTLHTKMALAFLLKYPHRIRPRLLSSAVRVSEKFGCFVVSVREECLPEISGPRIKHNLSYAKIHELEHASGECRLTVHGAFAIDTGKFKVRSPNDKYIVKDPTSHDDIWCGGLKNSMPEDVFEELHEKMLIHLANKKELFVFDGYAGTRPSSRLKVRVVSPNVWAHHFAKNMLIRPKETPPIETFAPDITIYSAPSFTNTDWRRHGLNSEKFAAFHLGKRVVLIGGTSYTGEIRKGVFTVMNYYQPKRGVLPMHCSANVGKKNGDVALYFGLSGASDKESPQTALTPSSV